MPIYSNNGRYRSDARPVRRKRRTNLWLPVLVCLLVVSLLGLMVWATWPKPEEPEISRPTAPVTLELPQQVQINSLILADAVMPQPEEFVSGLEGTGICVSFMNEPENILGQQTVMLRFSRGETSCTRAAILSRFHMETRITMVMGQEQMPDIRDFVPDESLDAAFVGMTPEQIPPEQVGDIELKIACAGREYSVFCAVEERIPPQATAQQVQTETGKLPDPATLVKDVQDHSQVTVTYQQEPDLSVVGSVKVTVVLTDAFGNTSTVESVITVVPAANAPKFAGLTDLYVRVGTAISYKSGVKATDPEDGEVAFTINNAQVNRDKEGVYTAYYSATDADGNTTIVPRKIIVETVDQAAVHEYAQQILDKIITPGMTRDQKIYAVYCYTYEHVAYVGTSDKSSIINSAYEGFTTGRGDCYTYYAMNVVFFELLGIENLEVTRIGGTSHHWWNLVLFDDGKYYHVDSCPTRVKREDVFHGKMTDSDLVVYTNDPGVIDRRPNFYVYDKTLPAYEGIEIAP